MKQKLTKKEKELLESIASRYNVAMASLTDKQLNRLNENEFSIGHSYGYIGAMVYDLEILGIISHEEHEMLRENAMRKRKDFFEIFKY